MNLEELISPTTCVEGGAGAVDTLLCTTRSLEAIQPVIAAWGSPEGSPDGKLHFWRKVVRVNGGVGLQK